MRRMLGGLLPLAVAGLMLAAGMVQPAPAEARVFVGVGVGFGPYWGWPYPYPYPYPYYAAPPVVYAPTIYAAPAPAPVARMPPAQSWYYCDNPKGYYPYVGSCAAGWQQVPAQQH